MERECPPHDNTQSHCLVGFFAFAAFVLVFAALVLAFAAFVLTLAATFLGLVLAALVIARLAAVGVGAVGAVVGGASGVGAGALVLMVALVLTHFGLSGGVGHLLGGSIVVASRHTESKSGSHKSS